MDLDPAASEDLNQENGKEITRDVARCGYDQVPVGVSEQLVVLGFARGETNGGEENRLIEIEAIESYIDQEPAGRGAN